MPSGIIEVVIQRAILTLSLLIATLLPVLASDEACRIRVHNEPSGLVQVSLDRGETWATVGRVRSPANARIFGFAAASYVPHGTVAATAVHGIRIKTGQYALGIGKAQKAMLFSIEPLEFSRIPNGYGGHLPRSSGIYTDIFSGRSIFRNESPYVGNSVFVERDRVLRPMPEDYTPIEGETFVIVVTRPDKPISEIDFENKPQGQVTVLYPDGSSEVIASVDRPVKGTGRYDGTTFTGVGSINTNHGGVITISTAPTCPPMIQEGGAQETRGGFMIQPYYHVKEQGEESPQVIVVGPKDSKKPRMEGTPPLFFGNINLSKYWGHPENSYRAQVKIDDGPWEETPKILGKVDDSFTPKYLEAHFLAKGAPRKVTQGVTAVRILFPKPDPNLLARDLADEAVEYTKRVKDVKSVKGTASVTPSAIPNGNRLTSFYLDGTPAFVTSAGSCRWDWDTTRATNGLHEIEIEVAGATVEKRVLLVAN